MSLGTARSRVDKRSQAIGDLAEESGSDSRSFRFAGAADLAQPSGAEQPEDL